MILLAYDAYAEQNISYGLATSNTGYYSFTVMDIGAFDQSIYSMGNYHYGFGYGSLQIGNGVGIDLSSSSGVVLLGMKNKPTEFSPMFGMELGGRLKANTNSSVVGYYEWYPGFSLGIQARSGSLQYTLVGKGGLAIGNFGRQDVFPNGAMYLGAGSYLNYGYHSLGAEHLVFGGSSTQSLSVKYGVDEYRGLSLILAHTQGSGVESCDVKLVWTVAPF
jgi:hypothetical protein